MLKLKNEKKAWIIGGVILIAILGIIWFLKNYNKPKQIVQNVPLDKKIESDIIIGNDDFPLKIGSQGEKVKAVQIWLNTVFNKQLHVSGIFNEKTEKALLESKNRNNISQKYWNKINFNQFLE